MDFNEKKNVHNKREDAGLISKLFFLWVFPLFRKGSKTDLTIDDMFNTPKEHVSEHLTKRLEKEWDDQCARAATKGKQPKLLNALFRAFGKSYAFYVMIFMFDGWVIRVSQPIFLRLFIRSFSDSSISVIEQCVYAGGVCLSTFIHILLNHPTAFHMCVSGMRCRVAASSLIYRKALKLSQAAQGKSSVGQIVNLLSNDVSRFDYNLHFIAYFFVGPVQLLIFTCILYVELGPASMAGVAYILLLSPSQHIIGKLSAKFRMKIAKYADERSQIMNEIIIAMRLIKMYAWEKPFSNVINGLRRMEMKSLKRRSLLRASFMGVFTSNYTFVPFLAILTYALTGNQVTADKAFFAVAIFNVMTEIMMYFVPNAAANMGDLVSSIKRIEDFLLLEEQAVQENLVIKDTNKNTINRRLIPSVQMKNVSATWGSDKNTLENLTLDVKGDQLIMVVGPVGCGKTSFLQTLISELPIKTGKCILEGRTAYSSQEAWIFPGNVRQNILLGKEFDKERYNQILSVCQLEADLKQLPYGDMSVVGERGTSLSGGQKARVNMARALYQEAEIYLLDDPLSAVDAAVSRNIFDLCIKKYLTGRLRILVTHQLQYLSQADHVIVLTDGKILAQGTYDKLMEDGIDFVSLVANEKEENTTTKEKEEVEEFEDVEEKKCEKEKDGPDKHSESMAGGAITGRTYLDYFRAGDSICGVSFLISGFIIAQIFISVTDYWLAYWTNTESNPDIYTNASFQSYNYTDVDLDETVYKPVEEESIYFTRNFYITVYASLASAVFVIDTIRTIFIYMYCMRISDNVHNKMFATLVRAPMQFFDQNPSGRVMNRFTKDLGALDEYLPISLCDTLDIFFRMFGVLVIVVVANHILSVPAVILLIALALLRNFFVKTARNLKRIESIARSPLYTHLSSSVQGLATIRSSHSQQVLTNQFDRLQDLHTSSWHPFIAGNNWFSIWLEITSTIFLTVVTYSFIVMSDSTSSGKVGLALSSLLQLMNVMQFGMRQSAEVENLMTSVERTLEYTRLKAEAALESSKDKKPSVGWPNSAAIKFRKVYLSYDGKQDILKNLTFEIKSKEKIGIVGRTGAGKSSIIAALFRLTEPRGEIIIDNVSINKIGLHDLREKISIIPQEPILFSGTIRYNLDPFNAYTDDDLWNALEEVELKDSVAALDFVVSEGGSNFSVGQRQLVCLARALLRKNRIILMDEATANVDPRTDNQIQQTIRTKFSDCTIITIAHRLHTVMDCDRILVLDNGYLLEFDHPHILLQNPEGLLSSMITHMGKSSHANLRQIAKEAYENHQNTKL